jgi:hypothetical protein
MNYARLGADGALDGRNHQAKSEQPENAQPLLFMQLTV